jgi:FtsH-binding integral membrane protein
MLRQGPVSLFLHGVIEYVAGVLLIAAPFLFNFHAGAAKAVAIVAGVIVLVIAASTVGRTSLVDSLPLPAHILLDYALALGLIASPFLFGYSGEGAPTAFFIILGVAHLLITIGTRFRSEATST